MNKEMIFTFFTRLAARLPQPTTELAYKNPYTLLVAVILSAQATDVGVNRATKTLFAAADTPAAMVKLGVKGLERFIKTIGLYRGKSKNIIAMSAMLLAQHKGEVPHDRDALEALPGVGRKSANVILNTIFGEPTIAVDTHVFRVANRTGLAPGATVRAVEDRLLKVIPEKFMQNAHHWLVLHGRYTCKARLPECWHCPVNDVCDYPDKVMAPPPEKKRKLVS